MTLADGLAAENHDGRMRLGLEVRGTSTQHQHLAGLVARTVHLDRARRAEMVGLVQGAFVDRDAGALQCLGVVARELAHQPLLLLRVEFVA